MSLSQTTVRSYRRDEIQLITGYIMSEVPKLPHYAGITVDAERITQVLSDGLRDEGRFMGRVLVNDKDEVVGGVCGYCVTQLLSWDKMTGDIFLYILPDWRNIQNVVKLMMAYRNWGIAQGATIISATQTGGYKQEQLGKLLERFGDYQMVGAIYYYKPKGGLARVLKELENASVS